MKTELLDNTISDIMQDNPAVEYVEPRESPIAAIPNETQNRVSSNPLFDFNAEHNGVQCIESLRPEDRGTGRQFRFTAKMLSEVFECKFDTIQARVKALVNTGDLNDSKNLESLNIPNLQGNGAVKTTLYDLTVFNKLAMTFIDNPRAVEMRKAFNDVLVQHETGIVQHEMSDAEIMSRALEIAHRTLALREERIKALTAERDEAIRTKTQYQSNLAAQMSGRVGGLTTALNRVKLENDRLKGDRLTKEDVYIIMNTQGVSFTLKTVKDVIRDALNTISEYLDEPFPKIKTGEHTDGNGKVFDVQSYVYTRKTVKVFFEFVENNPLGWQARNRKFILNEWLSHHMTIPA